MNNETFDVDDHFPPGSGHSEATKHTGTQEDPCNRSIEVHEASFAIKYLRSACRGAIPNSLRQRIGESDLVQDTLLRATQSIAQFRGTSTESFRCWLREIYQNRLKNLVRAHVASEKRSVRREESSLVLPSSIAVNDAKQGMIDETATQQLRVMNDAFQQLSRKDQQVVELHSRRGLRFDQVAAMLGATESSVRKRYSRAMTRWRKLVQRASRDQP